MKKKPQLVLLFLFILFFILSFAEPKLSWVKFSRRKIGGRLTAAYLTSISITLCFRNMNSMHRLELNTVLASGTSTQKHSFKKFHQNHMVKEY
jgi:hypothetical protein